MHRKAAFGLLLAVLSTVAYASAVDNPFVYDDLTAISNNLFVRTPRAAWAFLVGSPTSQGFANNQFRPLPMLSLAINYQSTGVAPRAFRLTNLALHIANCLLAFAVLRRVLRSVPLRRTAGVLGGRESEWAAVLGAALLAVHPTHSLVVLLVWKRATLLATVFSLLALWCLLRFRGMGDPEGSRPSRPSLWFPVGMVCSQLLALSSKETALVLPALLLLVDLWPRDKHPRLDKQSAKHMAALHAPLWALSLIFLVFLYPHTSRGATLSPLTYLATQMKVVWFYAATLVAPNMLSIAYAVDIPSGLDPKVILGGLGIGAMVVSSLVLAKRAPLPTLCVPWALIALLPTSSLFPIPLLVDEDRIYLSAVLPWGLVGALAVTGARRGRRTRTLIAAASILVVLSAMAFTLARGVLWSSPPLVWLDARMRYPNSYHANTGLCGALSNEPAWSAQALSVCREAVNRYPEADEIREGLVWVLAKSNRLEDAEAVLAEGFRRQPDSGRFLRAAGHLAWARDRPAEAIDYYERSLRRLPLDETVALYLGASYAEVGRTADALHMAKQLIAWPAPQDPSHRLELARLYHTVGWHDQACAVYATLKTAMQESVPLMQSGRDMAANCPNR
jgi:hypothetical protein